MSDHGRSRLPRIAFLALLATAALVVIVIGALALGNHEGLGSERLRKLYLPALGLLLLASAFGLWAWARERRAESDAVRAAQEDARRRVEAAEREAQERARAEREAADERVARAERAAADAVHEHEQRDRRREAELHAERGARARTEQARRMEKEWSRELREQVSRLHRENGLLGSGDVRELVLRIAVELLDAEKGLLLSREDLDGDGDLELVSSLGFDADPSHSAVTQRLAGRVLERDEIIHEDDLAEIDRERRTPADEEITNLVAIPVFIADEFSGVIVCANRDGGFAECEDDVLLALGDHTGTLLQNGRLHGQLRGAYLATVNVLAQAIEAKDPFLKGHSEDVAALVAAVADRVGVDRSRREELVFGSLLHDVGKLGISERILLKPGALTPEERTAVELHPRIGFRMVERVPALKAIAPAVLHHHEHFDGNGYPTGLRGEAIPLEARIVAVADCYSAMTMDRPYRGAMTSEEACEELLAGAGTQFDPEIVRIFVEEVRRGAGPTDRSALESSLVDPELEVLRGDGGLLGTSAVELTDGLTLLYSHRHFHEAVAAQAHRAAATGAPFTLVLGEIDGLDEINRTRGFGAGDDEIRRAADAFERVAAGEPGGLAARISGRRLALLSTRGGSPEALEANVRAQLNGGARVRTAAVAWESGDDGFATLDRANAALLGGRVRTVASP